MPIEKIVATLRLDSESALLWKLLHKYGHIGRRDCSYKLCTKCEGQSARVNAIYNLQSALCNVQSTIYVQSALYNVQSTVYNPQFLSFSPQLTN